MNLKVVKLKIEFFNKARVVVGTDTTEVKVLSPALDTQLVDVCVHGDVKPSILCGVRLLRMDDTRFLEYALQDTFIGDNQRMHFHLDIELNPDHIEFLLGIAA